jgi:hypothetical protein
VAEMNDTTNTVLRPNSGRAMVDKVLIQACMSRQYRDG